MREYFDTFFEELVLDGRSAVVGIGNSTILWTLRDGCVRCGLTRQAFIADLHHPDSLNLLRATYEYCQSASNCSDCSVEA
jgi:hypothetical protein